MRQLNRLVLAACCAGVWCGGSRLWADDPAAIAARIESGRAFWSFQPPQRVPLPETARTDWVRRPMDAFVLAALERRDLAPSAPAGRRTLIRRAYFDLIGLPPEPEEVESFVNDPDPGAYERLIERLLASPHYGERWGRYWLDLTRYSDVNASWLDSIAQAWLYRDWVVRAFNEDLPYDQFVRRQLATDLMPETGPEDAPALGFLGLSPVYWKELQLDPEVIKVIVAEEWEERIDAVTRTFLGLTVACARCHDHMYEPVSTEDYYALAGVFAGTRLVDRPLIPEAEAAAVRESRERVAALQDEIRQLEAAEGNPEDTAAQVAAVRQEIARLERETPHYRAPLAHGVDDAAIDILPDGPDRTKIEYRPGEPRDLALQIRGNPSNRGDVVPRGFLAVLSDGPRRRFTDGSGRRELAEALVAEGAPLSARVIVNRVWKHHFGRGLVETPSDFGVQGARPSHPELLDDLTARFRENGWSIKWLHREIMLSAAYRQRSKGASGPRAAQAGDEGAAAPSASPDPHAVDPENRWLWRMNRRRLDVEAWRDAMLAVSGTIDRTVGGPAAPLNSADNRRRTLYGIVDRYEISDMLRIYDFPDPMSHSPKRDPTTTPLQQLFVLNSPFVRQQAQAVAARVASEVPNDAGGQIRRAYALLFGRPPTDAEMQLGAAFLGGGPDGLPTAEAWRQYAQALLGSNEFLFVD